MRDFIKDKQHRTQETDYLLTVVFFSEVNIVLQLFSSYDEKNFQEKSIVFVKKILL